MPANRFNGYTGYGVGIGLRKASDEVLTGFSAHCHIGAARQPAPAAALPVPFKVL